MRTKLLALGLFAGSLAASMSVSAETDKFGLPAPGAEANVTVTYSMQGRPSAASKNGAVQPPADPKPGDRTRRDWTECSRIQCTDYYREDRFQREDAPIEGTDPNAGSGPHDWIPIEWSSQQCTPFIVCREKIGGEEDAL